MRAVHESRDARNSVEAEPRTWYVWCNNCRLMLEVIQPDATTTEAIQRNRAHNCAEDHYARHAISGEKPAISIGYKFVE
jgi:hypothetical protein